ncbi:MULTISPECIES: hypothetical protein [Luteibacter]|uniref:hypothetical protein n=1 Tax=Luteibacter TaxID=242605 RepID=UPI00056A306A|nr:MULTISPECIES: hypothetical protein [unclassified Luteibacter]
MYAVKKVMRLAFVALIIVCSGPTLAAINNARNIVYFDANNKIVGQQFIQCDNRAFHAGVIDTSNPYHMEMDFGCGNPVLVDCETSNGNTFCSYDPDYATRVPYFLSATGYTIQDYCDGNYNHATEFVGRSDCAFPAPQEISTIGPWLSGWGS